jgi:hypothetical protein
MNFIELRNEIEILVDPQDADMESSIPSLINEAIVYIANEPGIILPDLKSIVSVNTVVDQSYTTLPNGTTTYGGKVIYASVGGEPVTCFNTLEDIMQEYPAMDEVGDIESVAVEGQTVWYAKQPEEETAMLLLLYADPPELEDDEDIPSSIPKHLHRETIVRRVASVMFDMIEQGEDGSKINTIVQTEFYDKGITKLREFLASKRRGMSRSVWLN